MRVVLHAGASADIEASALWYATEREGLGEEFLDEVSRALEAISAAPRTWPVWPGSSRGGSVRRFALARFPFGVAYRIIDDRIVVLAVAHAKRKPGYWFDRLGGKR